MSEIINIDLTGLKCPMPIIELHRLMKNLDEKQQVSVIADDPAFCLDVEAWCRKTGHHLISLEKNENRLIARIEKVLSEEKSL